MAELMTQSGWVIEVQALRYHQAAAKTMYSVYNTSYSLVKIPIPDIQVLQCPCYIRLPEGHEHETATLDNCNTTKLVYCTTAIHATNLQPSKGML